MDIRIEIRGLKRLGHAGLVAGALVLWIPIGLGAESLSVVSTPVRSLIQLVGNPKESNRKEVWVGGVFELMGDSGMLFVSSEHAEAKDLASSILLELEPLAKEQLRGYAGQWIWVFGRFYSEEQTLTTPWPGKVAVAEVKLEPPQ